MTAEDAINVFKEQFCGLEAYCEIHRDGLCLTDGCEVWWAIKALEQCKADIAGVVRCKDCRWYKTNYMWNGTEVKICAKEAYEPRRNADDFCSNGERK